TCHRSDEEAAHPNSSLSRLGTTKTEMERKMGNKHPILRQVVHSGVLE
ncbi:uncharacterized, partial [Tachysurus ichikawai]